VLWDCAYELVCETWGSRGAWSSSVRTGTGTSLGIHHGLRDTTHVASVVTKPLAFGSVPTEGTQPSPEPKPQPLAWECP
jgi:hypothetical protein